MASFFQSHWLLILLEYFLIFIAVNIPTILYIFLITCVEKNVYKKYATLKETYNENGDSRLLKKLKFYSNFNSLFENNSSGLKSFLKNVYCVISFTLTGLSIVLTLMVIISLLTGRYMYNHLDSRKEYYMNIPAEKLQATTIQNAESWNDDLKSSMFLSTKERQYVEDNLIDTQLLWARFWDSVGEKRFKGEVTRNVAE